MTLKYFLNVIVIRIISYFFSMLAKSLLLSGFVSTVVSIASEFCPFCNVELGTFFFEAAGLARARGSMLS